MAKPLNIEERKNCERFANLLDVFSARIRLGTIDDNRQEILENAQMVLQVSDAIARDLSR